MQDMNFGSTKRGPRPIPAWDRMDNRGIDKPAPAPQQVTKPYCILLLKGCCTRFFSTTDDFVDERARLLEQGKPHLCFRHEPELGTYVQYNVISTG